MKLKVFDNHRAIVLSCLSMASWPSFAVELFLEAEQKSLSETVSISAAQDFWRGDYQDGDRQWHYVRAVSGVQFESWRLGLIYREEQDLQFSPEAGLAYHRLQNGLPILDGQYRIQLQAQQFSGSGLYLAWNSPQSFKHHLRIAVNILNTDNLFEGQFVGIGTVENGDINYQAQADFAYSIDPVLQRPGRARVGYGAGLDLSLYGDFSQRLRYSFNVYDAASILYWPDAPQTQAIISSSSSDNSAQGLQILQPSLQGREFNADLTSSLPIKTELNTQLYNQMAAINAGLWTYDDQIHYYLGTSLFIGEKLELKTNYWPTSQTLELGGRWAKVVDVAIGADALDVSQSHSLFVSLGAHWAFD